MNLSFMLCGCLAFVPLLVHGQDQQGFVSIDCGLIEADYADDNTSISYTSGAQYVDTGTNHNISSDYEPDSRQLSSLRSFPKGIKNCYTIEPRQAEGYNKYLIRAIFMYGNYDSKNKTPEFDLYLDGDQWDTITFEYATDIVTKEIIHVPATAYIHVCLVNTGSGTPFISALELRPLNNSLYQITESGSLKLFVRWDFGSTTNETVRYPSDSYDRIWLAFTNEDWEAFSAPFTPGSFGDEDYYKPPSSVMATAVIHVNGSNTSNSLNFYWNIENRNQKFYMYLHFAEIEQLAANELREFQLYINDALDINNISPRYLVSDTKKTTTSLSADSLYFSLRATDKSTLPPILNAIEVYEVLELRQSPTKQSEVDAIRKIKLTYQVEKNWQGDPCVPRVSNLIWEGLQCNYDSNSPKIISLNLSSSSLSGNMDNSFSSFESLESLDLSNNNFIGQVPDFLSRLPSLKTLNLSHNSFTSSIPSALIEKSNNGSLTLSTEGYLHLVPAGTLSKSQEDSCARKKNYVVPVNASIASCLVIVVVVVILAIWWSLKRKKQQEDIVKSNAEDEIVEEKNRHFTYSELLTITNNFQKVLGKGGFGSVYAGHLTDGTQVAVKMLSLQSTQGSKQFRTEAQLLTKIHHRNLVSIIGFCNDGTHMGLIYEYMANGTIQEHLSEKNANILSWEKRLRIACDGAQGLEYLHDGCTPPIIHRDIKTANILLAENMQAKISDFGISRLMPLDGGTPVSTAVAGTVGYMDPEYQLTEKSDVYSFGIVLLELITGKPLILRTHEMTHIVNWVRPMFERAEIKEIVDSRLNSDFDTNSAWKAVKTALACVEHSSIQRPAMRQVVAELRECLEMEIARVMDWKENEAYNSASSGSL